MSDTPTGDPAPPTSNSSSSSSAATLLLIMSGMGAVVFAASLAAVFYLVAWTPPGRVDSGSFLAVTLGSSIQDAPVQGGLLIDPDDFPPITTEVAAAIRRSATDDRIQGIYLKIDQPGFGWGGAQEIRSALVDFRGSGKPCVGYSEVYSTLGYYVASSCDHVAMAPAGIGMVLGLAANTTYYRGTFDLLGIEPAFEHVGDFKTAVEPYERTEPSEASLESTRTLLDSLWGQCRFKTWPRDAGRLSM